jgi:hypothetical protein
LIDSRYCYGFTEGWESNWVARRNTEHSDEVEWEEVEKVEIEQRFYTTTGF